MAISDLIQETIAQHIVSPRVLSYAPSKLNEVTGRFVSANRIYNFVLDKSGVSYSPAGQNDSLLFSALYLRQDAVRKPKVGNDRCNAGKSYQCGKICLGNRRKCHKGVRDVNDARRIASVLAGTNEWLKNKTKSDVSEKALKRGQELLGKKRKAQHLLTESAKHSNTERATQSTGLSFSPSSTKAISIDFTNGNLTVWQNSTLSQVKSIEKLIGELKSSGQAKILAAFRTREGDDPMKSPALKKLNKIAEGSGYVADTPKQMVNQGYEFSNQYVVKLTKKEESTNSKGQSTDDTDALNRLGQLEKLGQEASKKLTEQKVDIKKPMSLDEVKNIYGRLRSGDITANELHQQWDRMSANMPSFEAELKKMKKADLLKLSGYHARSSDPKDELVKSALSNATGLFNIKGSVSYTMGEETHAQALDKLVKRTTDKDIQDYAAKHKKESDERSVEVKRIKDGIENPKTTEDFKNIVRYKHGGDESKLSDEHKEQYDEALAKDGKEKRFKQSARKAEVAAASVPTDLGMSYEKGKHSKTGADLHIVKTSDRVSKEAYTGLKDRAKGLDGYYSSFVKGFIFKTEENAQKFAKNEHVKGEDVVTAKQETKQNTSATRIKELADKVMESAEESLGRDRLANTHRRARMAGNAEYEATKNKQLAESMLNVSQAIEDGNTKFLDRMSTKADFVQMEGLVDQAKYEAFRAKDDRFKNFRSDELAHVPTAPEDIKHLKYPYPSIHSDNLKRFLDQTANVAGMKKITDELKRYRLMKTESGKGYLVQFDNPEYLKKFKDYAEMGIKKGVFDSHDAYYLTDGAKNYDRLQRMGITNDAELRAAAREYLTYRGKRGQNDPVKTLEREIIGQKFEGYFPTPKGLADRVAETADIKPNMRVLEPSAGKGSLADAALPYLDGNKANITTIEPVSALQNILKVKGYNVSEDRDFMEHKGEYDRIIMNPPFENMQDADHVKHAYSLLAKGGKLVAITGEAPFFRGDKKAVEFRDWLDSVGGSSEKLPDGSFKTSDRSTGVSTRLVVITKH